MYKFNLTNKERNLVAKLKSNIFSVALYGGNSSKHHIINYCNREHIDIICFLQEHEDSIDNKWNIPVMSAADFLQLYDNPLIITGNVIKELPPAVKLNKVKTLAWYSLFEDEYNYKEIIDIGAETWCYANSDLNKKRLLLNDDCLEFKYINISITQRCNLTCKDCNHLIPYIPNPIHYDVNECKKAIYQLSKSIDYIHHIGILGGEAFLHAELIKIIDYALSFNNIGYVAVLTNGTIMPSRSLLKFLQNPRVILKISNYNNLSRALNKIIPVLEDKHILYRILNDLQWTKFGPVYKRKRTVNELELLLKACSPATCYHVKWPYLYKCPYAGSLSLIEPNIYTSGERVNLSDSVTQLRNNLAIFKTKAYFTHCQYCNGGAGEPVAPAAQLPSKL